MKEIAKTLTKQAGNPYRRLKWTFNQPLLLRSLLEIDTMNGQISTNSCSLASLPEWVLEVLSFPLEKSSAALTSAPLFNSESTR